MATDAGARGRGLGGAVLAALIEHAREHGAARVWCNARTPARAFYERAGFHVTSEEFEIAPIGPHFVMEWVAHQVGPGALPGSPFVSD
jgi:ribosomal protein S18 acetylase RimI-like enzyme